MSGNCANPLGRLRGRQHTAGCQKLTMQPDTARRAQAAGKAELAAPAGTG